MAKREVRNIFNFCVFILAWLQSFPFSPETPDTQAIFIPMEVFKVARYSFSGPIPPKFEHKLRRHKQSFGKIATAVVLDKDENLLS